MTETQLSHPCYCGDHARCFYDPPCTCSCHKRQPERRDQTARGRAIRELYTEAAKECMADLGDSADRVEMCYRVRIIARAFDRGFQEGQQALVDELKPIIDKAKEPT